MKKLTIIISICSLLNSCEAIFIKNISNEKIVLLAPSDNTQLDAGLISFNWQTIEDADNYNIQIATPNFKSATKILLDTIINNKSIDKDLTSSQYEWRVKAMNTEYETSYSTNSFTIK
ncbi:hypothetical protein [Tenacibaculum halocynthiae]|uniref:hypothetical protein n=1 Tax=Tenacibaculum halocynthiae TaxID=1254437 RepID=UPI003D653F1E